MALNVLSIGGSRNIGYFSTVRLLESGATVTFLLRSPATFDADETIQKYVKSGKARLVKGDALVKQDVQHVWDEAVKDSPVDLLLFSVGATGGKFSVTKGVIITPVNLVTQSLFNALTTMPTAMPQPRIVTISSIGVTRSSHASLPILLKPLYSYLIAEPHKDKVGAERLISYCTGWPWNVEDAGEPGEDIMGPDWMASPGLPAAGSLNRVLVIRPALLTDGECVAEKQRRCGSPPYRVSEKELGGWTVSRKDVAHFIADAVLNRWNEFEDKCVNISY